MSFSVNPVIVSKVGGSAPQEELSLDEKGSVFTFRILNVTQRIVIFTSTSRSIVIYRPSGLFSSVLQLKFSQAEVDYKIASIQELDR